MTQRCSKKIQAFETSQQRNPMRYDNGIFGFTLLFVLSSRRYFSVNFKGFLSVFFVFNIENFFQFVCVQLATGIVSFVCLLSPFFKHYFVVFTFCCNIYKFALTFLTHLFNFCYPLFLYKCFDLSVLVYSVSGCEQCIKCLYFENEKWRGVIPFFLFRFYSIPFSFYSFYQLLCFQLVFQLLPCGSNEKIS